MAKTRKTAQRKRASKEANAANMAFLEEEKTEPKPGPSKKKQHDLTSILFVQKTPEPQPGPSKKKQRNKEEKTEPKPGPSNKKQHDLTSILFVQKTSEPQPGPSNKKQRIEEEMPIQPMDLTVDQESRTAIEPDIVDNDATDPLEVKQLANVSSKVIKLGAVKVVQPMDLTVDQESLTAIEPDIVDSYETDPLEVKQLANVSSKVIKPGAVKVVHVEQAAPQTIDEVHFECVDLPQDSHVQCYAKIEALQKQVSELTAENTMLKDKNTKLDKQNWKLQCKMVEDTNKRTSFTITSDKTGYPSPEWLLKASKVAKDSDYLFVKELMMYLWPNGVGRVTITGRASNNPTGRKKPLETTTDETAGPSGTSTTTSAVDPLDKLDPDKVNFIKASLMQRREILDDDYGVAQELANKTFQHINRVMSNNPSMKCSADRRDN